MLVEFSVANFRSIRGRQTLSLVANSAADLRASNVVLAGAPSTPELVRSAVIYGANAAGKSNLLRALALVEDLVINSARESRMGDPVPVTPFRLDDASGDQPSEFEVVLVQDGVRFQYGFTADRVAVHSEWLVAFPEGRPQRWFERRPDGKWYFGPHLKSRKAIGFWKEATRANALFLSTAAQWNAEQLAPVHSWFLSRLRFFGLDAPMSAAFTIQQCATDEEERERIAQFLRVADIAVEGIDVEKQDVNELSLPPMPDRLRKALIENGVMVARMRHRKPNGDTVTFDLDEESQGTRKLFALAGPWLDVLANGWVLLVDELDTSLHPTLMHHIVSMFHDPEINKRGAQLIFTTHDTNMLAPDVFRRDQIWFVEKDADAQSRLYPLTDFSPRKGENFERGYLQGRYGAVPFVGDWRM